ncbi:uncharacterized protein ARMOST_02500 [Armillaria ostoyae]|uniref:Uncharacterized protein n=1 Tax=Armillaria ostoyae TaxID=47428 RepID=A0A284QRV7_ARMOS|nr:uncharacterized protein ARMOST_02500 [Armillaria ostoyae]
MTLIAAGPLFVLLTILSVVTEIYEDLLMPSRMSIEVSTNLVRNHPIKS